MINLFRILCIVVFAILANTTIIFAQDRYRTDLLKEMALSLNINQQLDTIADGHYTDWKYRRRILHVVVEDSLVNHIGYFLFSSQQREAVSPIVCNFIERYLLAFNLPLENSKEVEKQLAEDEIVFIEGDIDKLYKIVGDTTLNLALDNINDKQYKISWYKKDKLYASMKFPIGYDLLYGTTMEENERRIADGLRQIKVVATNNKIIKKESLQTTWQPNYYILPGDYYLLEQLNSNRYYEKTSSGDFKLIFNTKYPVESVANLLQTTEIAGDFNVDVCLKKYPFNKDFFEMPLDLFLSYFLQQGCSLYFGVVGMDEAEIKSLLITHNPQEGYCHTIDVVIRKEIIKNKKGNITATISCYIPTSKIKNLFAD